MHQQVDHQIAKGIIEVLNEEGLSVLQIGKGEEKDYYVIVDFNDAESIKSSFHTVEGMRINKILANIAAGTMAHGQKQRILEDINNLVTVKRKYEKGDEFPFLVYESLKGR